MSSLVSIIWTFKPHPHPRTTNPPKNSIKRTMTTTVCLAIPLEDLLPEIHGEIEELEEWVEIILKV